MKIVLIGGHPSPAIATVEELKGNELLYLGRKYTFEGEKALSLEYQTITSEGVPFYGIITGRLQRKFTQHTIPSLLKLPIGFIQSFLILLFKKPNVVVGFGGYLELPVVFAAWILRIPIVIHEQTLSAGLANRVSGRLASRICISWESSRKFFPREKVVLTGNPIRKGILDSKSSKTKEKLIYVTGGSSGSHAINQLIAGCIKELLKIAVVVHQTGDSQEHNDFEKLEKLRVSLPKDLKDKYILKKFLSEEEVSETIQEAVFVVGRAGINTISELILWNKPCLLIPLPQGGEQKQNANYIREIGLGDVVPQEKLSSKSLFAKLEDMLENINRFQVRKNLLVKDASRRLSKVIFDVAKKA